MAHLLILLLGLEAAVIAHHARKRSTGNSSLLGTEPSLEVLAGSFRESCIVSGDPHYKTYDGYRFNFMGNCTYLLSQVCHPLPNLPSFRVEETNARRAGYEEVSFVKSVTVEVNGTKIMLLKGRRVTVDGQRVNLPVALVSGLVTVHLSGMYVLVQTNFGLRVRFDGNQYAEVSVPSIYMRTLCGLCGNYNGEMYDDNRMPNGTSSGSNANRLGASWQVADAGDPGCTNTGKPMDCFSSVLSEAQSPKKRGGLTDPKGLFAPCHSKVSPEGAFDNCVYDYCATGGDHISLCFALQSYAERCTQAGVPIPWRETFFCYPNCPPNSRFRYCGPVCPATCLHPDDPDSCPGLPCVDGCVCKRGYLLSGDQCVPPSECGCTDSSGRYHQAGESWMEDQNCTQRCTCDLSHNITCEEWQCSPVQECRPVDGLLGCQDTEVAACQVSGDPHYFTFDGTMFSFMGTCTYTLVTTTCHSDSRLPSFTLTGRNEERGQPQASFLQQVNLEVANASITLQKGQRVLLNGKRVRMPVDGQVAGVTITTSSIYVILQTNFGLVVKFDGNHILEIQLPGSYFGKVCGLCGNFNNQSQDDFLMPDGQIAANASQFGNSWKVPGDRDRSCQPDERQDEGPGCSSQEMGRLQVLCQEILAPKFLSCHAILDPLPFLQNCLYDMCQFKGMASVLCNSLQAYVEACQTRGVSSLSWRNSTFCPPPCPPHSQYIECASLCPATCLDIFAPLSCQSPTACVEGCVCDHNYIRSDNQCVQMQNCGCQDSTSDYYNHQESYLDQDCQKLCTCRSEVISCRTFQCPPGSRCALSPTGLRYCQPLEFHRCVISGDPHYRTFDNFVHHFQGPATYALTWTLSQLPEAVEPLQVAGMNWAPLPTHRVSFLHKVYISVYGYFIILMHGRQLVVNNVVVTPPFYPEDRLQITQSGRSLLLQTDFGLSVSFDGKDYAEIILPSMYKDHVGGLCGNYDGQRNNEYMKPNGTWTQNLTAFGNSWEVTVSKVALGKGLEAGGHLQNRHEEVLAEEADSGFEVACSPEQLMLVNGTAVCGAVSHPEGPFAACHSILSPSTFQESCVYDFCTFFNDVELLCQDYAAYAQLCQEEGVELGPWRQKTGCEMSCPPHTTYSSFMTACPATCANMGAPSDCDVPCVEGCASDPGYILSGLESVPFDQCGCTTSSQYYQANDTFMTVDCSQSCTCQGTGMLMCEQSSCPSDLICTVRNYTRGCFQAPATSACLRNPCLNGGTCQELSQGYRCLCPEGYRGTRCQVFIPTYVSPTSPSDHLPAVLIGVFIPIGIILIAGAAFCIYQWRKQASSRNEEYLRESTFYSY